MKKRNSIEVKVWMLRNNVTHREIEKTTGLNASNVSRTIDGARNCRAVLRYLLEKGCPAKHLSVPADMREAA